MLTGRRPRNLGEVPPREDDFPNFGAVLGKLRPTPQGTTPFVSFPWNISTSTNVVPGQNGGFLGQSFDPWRVEPAAGAAASKPTFDVPLANLPDGVDARRLRARRQLLDSLAASRGGAPLGELATIYERAFDLLLSPKFLEAFRVEREPEAVRERYGQNVFGQSLLFARGWSSRACARRWSTGPTGPSPRRSTTTA